VFGLSFWEIVLLLILVIVVAGPRQMPEMMRTLGRGIARARRLLFDMRAQSGIDEILRQEGLAQDIEEFRSLVRGNVIERLTGIEAEMAKIERDARRPLASDDVSGSVDRGDFPDEREYPVQGCDAYGAVAEDDPYAQIVAEGGAQEQGGDPGEQAG